MRLIVCRKPNVADNAIKSSLGYSQAALKDRESQISSQIKQIQLLESILQYQKEIIEMNALQIPHGLARLYQEYENVDGDPDYRPEETPAPLLKQNSKSRNQLPRIQDEQDSRTQRQTQPPLLSRKSRSRIDLPNLPSGASTPVKEHRRHISSSRPPRIPRSMTRHSSSSTISEEYAPRKHRKLRFSDRDQIY